MFVIEDINFKNWTEYKLIRLRALKEDPHAFGAKYNVEIEFPDEKWIERAKDVENGIRFGLIAKENNVPVGVIGASINNEKKSEVHIYSVFVAAEVRGKGVGSNLMSAILEKILTHPEVRKINLSVNADQLSAVRLYEKFGFKKVGEEKVILGDGIEHIENLMELNLLK